MKIPKKLFVLFLIGLSFVAAQPNNQTTSALYSRMQSVFKKDTLKILAVMVEFQEDKYDATVGTGKFGSHYTKNYQDTIVDPLPHNRIYFENHLEFAGNYYKKVSNNKLNIAFDVLPDVITVSKMMREYSPSYNSTDFTPLGNLSKESWELAHAKYPSFDFGKYDLFIIFHAGVSNAWNTGSIEINRNLPSLYLSDTALKNIYGAGFKGFIQQGNAYSVNNSIIMPEAESRETKQINDTIVFDQISINGVLVANIASFLGLPDLFNTETGMSAIGRFGLMDSQGMFANRGLFPPELSAWEKIFLGWAEPVIINRNKPNISIAAKSVAAGSDTTIVKIPISDTEYYLIENRLQDAKNDGIKITYKRSPGYFTDQLSAGSNGFFNFESDMIKGGVVTDVDEFDAALPGNGIVIWHIDEKIISDNIESNKINNDKLRRGVFVVEADGITDIGETVKTVFGDLIGEGNIEDFWFKENNIKYYTNEFSYTTVPPAKTTSGANSFVTVNNFSNKSSRMSFDVTFDGAITRKNNAVIDLPEIPKAFFYTYVNGTGFSYVLSGNDLFKFNSDGSILKRYYDFSNYKPAFYDNLYGKLMYGINGDKIRILNLETDQYGVVSLQAEITAPPVINIAENSIKEVIAGCANGEVYAFTPDAISPSLKFILPDKVLQIAAQENYISAVSNNRFMDINGVNLTIPEKIKLLAITKDKNGAFLNVILSENNTFFVISNGSIKSEFKMNNLPTIDKFILADIKKDGDNSIVFCTSDLLFAVNMEGIVNDNFPVRSMYGSSFNSSILSFNYTVRPTNSFSISSIFFIVSDTEGETLFIDGISAKIIKEMNISAGSEILTSGLHSYNTSPLGTPVENMAFTYITRNNNLSTWDIGIPVANKISYSDFTDYLNSSFFQPAVARIISSSLMPDGKVYNWPNPVYGDNTNIRFYTSENSHVSIKVFDTGGQITAEFEKDTNANNDTEVIWNVKNVKSGIYFARVEAISSSGKSETKIVKIAVIK